ncbi:MAG: discoidin domain-containing protein, partial [Muribaculaceae bacterium]|nr:discoidin domain-containing protein [Muribaculaceae bacterium]
PVTASTSIAGVPEISERGMAFERVFTATDQYGWTTTPTDVKWTLDDRDGNVRSVQSPLNISEAGLYTLRAVSAVGECSTELFVAPGLPVVSRGAKVAASSAENVGSMPEGAVDGDTNVRWGSAHTDSEWLTVDLGEMCYLSHVSILWEAAYAARYAVQLAPADAKMTTLNVNYAGQSRRVAVPEEAAWVTVVEESASSAGLKDTPVNASGRYLRILGIERGSAYGYSLYELSAYGVRESMPANAVLGVDFGLPEVMDRDETVSLVPHAYTRGGDMINDVDVVWSSDKESDFDGNSFTPRSHGLYTVRATLSGIGTSESIVFVNDVERIGAISLERDTYTVIGGDDIVIPFVVMNQFLAPYTGDAGEIVVSISDENGAPAVGVGYEAA